MKGKYEIRVLVCNGWSGRELYKILIKYQDDILVEISNYKVDSIPESYFTEIFNSKPINSPIKSGDGFPGRDWPF